MFKRRKFYLIVGLMLLLAILASLPVLAQTPLEHFAPREVKELPEAPVIFEPTPAKPRLIESEELERLVGFALLVPKYLPADCSLQERFRNPQTGVAYLNYSCVSIAEQRVQSVQRPLIGESSAEDLTINGQPALYVGGAWVRLPEQSKPTWMPGVAQQLIFERNDVLIRLNATARLSKEALIQIAESIR